MPPNNTRPVIRIKPPREERDKAAAAAAATVLAAPVVAAAPAPTPPMPAPVPVVVKVIPLTPERKAENMKVIRAVITLMDDLASLMKEETSLLAKLKFRDHGDLLKRKQRLALEYRATMKNIASQPDILKTAPDDMRAAVRAGAQRLGDLADANGRTLRSAMLAVQKLLQTVINMVKADTMKPGAYTNFKTDHMRLGTYSPKCDPVTIVRNV